MVKLIQQYLSDSARKFPDKAAANFRDQNITFRELDLGSNQLARVLQKYGVNPGDRVSFCLHKSINSLISILGILKADAVYVPLDARAPAQRLQKIINNAEPKLIICDNKTAGLIKSKIAILNLDKEKNNIDALPVTGLIYKNRPKDAAYILYTSGSTGEPKGVVISHANIINATDWAVSALKIKSSDKLSQHPPLHFDLSTFDLYCAFKSGATLFLVPEEISLFPGQLLKFIEDKKLSIWNSVPSVMVYLSTAKLIKPDRLTSLKKIFFASAVLGVSCFVLNGLGINILFNILISGAIYFGLLFVLKEKILEELKPVLRIIRG